MLFIWKKEPFFHENPFPFWTFRITDKSWLSWLLWYTDCHHSFPASLTNKLMDLICCNCLLSPFAFFFCNSPDSCCSLHSPHLLSSCPLFSTYRPVDGLTVSWKRDGRWLATGRQLVIPSPAFSDTGLYVCEALLSNSTAKPIEAKAHLTVMGKNNRFTNINTFFFHLYSSKALDLFFAKPK